MPDRKFGDIKLRFFVDFDDRGDATGKLSSIMLSLISFGVS
jgi:hypothetical protein